MNYKEHLESGKTIPFMTTNGTMAEMGEMKTYELNKDSKLEVEFLDKSKQTMGAIEFFGLKSKSISQPKPSEVIMNVKVLEN